MTETTDTFVYPVLDYQERKQPRKVKAIQYHGFESNSKEVELFLGERFIKHIPEENVILFLLGKKFETRLNPGHWVFTDENDELHIMHPEHFADVYTQLPPDITLIGLECFSDLEETVISWKGQEYLKPCGEPVTKTTFCVKFFEHPGIFHEDVEGNQNLREEYQQGTVPRDKLEVLWPRTAGGTPITKADMKQAWESHILPWSTKPNLTHDEQTIMAVMRHVYGVMPEDEE